MNYIGNDDVVSQKYSLEAVLKCAPAVAASKLGFARLKDFQVKAVSAWAERKHSFIVAGTGRGKSACFQLPALVGCELAKSNKEEPPIVLVISPLVALMRDHVQKLQARRIRAVSFGGHARESDPHAWARAMQGEVQIAYMSPEFAVGHVSALASMPRVSLLAIDEAHTIFEWGQTFRAEYGSLSKVHAALSFGACQRGEGSSVPIMCLTATCTTETRRHVLTSLQIASAEVVDISATSNCPNLMFKVLEMPDKERMRSALLQLLTSRKSTGNVEIASDVSLPTIIYTRKRVECNELAHFLVHHRIKALGYHGGMPDQERCAKQAQFQQNDVQVMVATAAFGMGIDKKDIRRVIHYGLPSSIEVYIQECGRAGRDGQNSECIALFTRRCRMLRERAILNDRQGYPKVGEDLQNALLRLRKADRYFRNREMCRRAQLLEYVGEDPCRPLLSASQAAEAANRSGFCHRSEIGRIICRQCDVCCYPAGSERCSGQDCRQALGILLKVVLSNETHPLSASMVCAIAGGHLRAASHAIRRHPHFGAGQQLGHRREDWSEILEAATDSDLMVRIPMESRSDSRYLAVRATASGRRWVLTQSQRPFLVQLGRKRAVDVCEVEARPVKCIRAFGRPPKACAGKQPMVMRACAPKQKQFHDPAEFKRGAKVAFVATVNDGRSRACAEVPNTTVSNAALQADDLRSKVCCELRHVQDVRFLNSVLQSIRRQHSLESLQNQQAQARSKIMQVDVVAPACMSGVESEMRKRKLPW
jgi:ATP-dependent DNA helicase RecQ